MSGSNKTKIGIMGGTFDPIHFGHLFIAECARYRFNLDKILFIPTGMPVHKRRKDIIDPVHRLAMTRLAVGTNPNFEVSTIETDRTGPTYAIDTLRLLHSREKCSQEYFFITGADAILDILTWKDVNEIFELCQFIAVTRPGISFDDMNRVKQGLTDNQLKRIHIYETAGILVSSTDIRRRAENGEPIKYLVPEQVEEYILENNFYRKQTNL